jgi:hypothetical protein
MRLLIVSAPHSSGEERLRVRRALTNLRRVRHMAGCQDIERQLAGQGFQDTAAEAAASDQLPAQKRLVEALRALMDCKNIEELYERRDAAINAVAAPHTARSRSAGARGSRPRRRLRQMKRLLSPVQRLPWRAPLLGEALLSVFERRPYRYFLCVRETLSVREDDPRMSPLCVLLAIWRLSTSSTSNAMPLMYTGLCPDSQPRRTQAV